jgi:ATP-dependent protease ClpP protease subunit
MTGHIFLDGGIGDEVTTKSVRGNIADYPQATEWTVHIQSGGGDVDEGYAIGQILKSLPKTTAIIGSFCASIATYAAHCCDKIVMGPAGDFTIHLPTGDVGGTADDHRRAADRLDRIKAELISRYMPRVGKKGITREQVSAMIDKETSMSPGEALAMGFVDDVQERLKAVAKLDINRYKMENTLTKEEVTGLFTTLGNKLDKFINKFKNSVEIALADGTLATSDAATPDALIGSTMLGADGQPLPDGQSETADGYVITIQGGKVTDYQPLMADKKDETEQLKKQVADLTAQLAAKNTEATQAVDKAVQIEASSKAQFQNLKVELEQLKAKTFGDTDPVVKNTNMQTDPSVQAADPMSELADVFRSSRFTNR